MREIVPDGGGRNGMMVYDGPLLCGFNVAIKGLILHAQDRLIHVC